MAGPQNAASEGKDSLGKIVRRNLSFARISDLARRGKETLRTRGWQALGREAAFRLNLAAHRPTWRYRADIPLRRELAAQRAETAAMENTPLISVVCPLYNTPPAYLRQMIDSVLRQSYPHFELVLPDASDPAHSKKPEVQKALIRHDARVRHLPLPENLGIAGNTNAGLAAAQGQYLCLLDHDDVLQPNALYEVARAAMAGADLIYSDEAVLDENLKQLWEFHFKGDYAPDTLRGCNTVTHLCAFSRHLLKDAGGGENPDYDGAQDYDLILRLSEKAWQIAHIPKVLYFWRRHGGSTAGGIGTKPKAEAAGAAALAAHLRRVGLDGTAEPQKDHPGSYRVRYAVSGAPTVSVLIPSCDHIDDLERCLASLYAKAGWDALEVLVLDNNSTQPETQQYYQANQTRWPNLKFLHYDGEFNFSAINNWGAKQATGTHLLLLNNDVEILSDGFVAELLGYSQRPDVGAVGALLYYPDDTIQHAGLIVGIGGTAGVSHKGHPRGNGGDMFRLCTTQNVSAVTGAALMVKTALYQELGGLAEEQFGVAFNDVDFCLRLRERGLWNVFTPFAQGCHFESKSRGYDTEGPRKQRFDREAAAFKASWAGVLQAGDPFYNPHFTLKTENFALR